MFEYIKVVICIVVVLIVRKRVLVSGFFVHFVRILLLSCFNYFLI